MSMMKKKLIVFIKVMQYITISKIITQMDIQSKKKSFNVKIVEKEIIPYIEDILVEHV